VTSSDFLGESSLQNVHLSREVDGTAIASRRVAPAPGDKSIQQLRTSGGDNGEERMARMN